MEALRWFKGSQSCRAAEKNAARRAKIEGEAQGLKPKY
jgi:hypothetical protein